MSRMMPDRRIGRRIARGVSTVLVLAAATATAAGSPDVATIVGRMKQVLEPQKSSLRRMTLTVSQDGSTSTVMLGQARGTLADGDRILTVVLAPPALQGMAYLVRDQPASDDDLQWAYLPAIGRVRMVVSPEAFSAFLNSDFTYADLGFTPLRSTYKLLGEETGQSGRVYRIEATPPQRWYYSRIVSTVAADSFLPIEREFYDPTNQRWKVERFQGVATVDGIPTVLTFTMDDVQAKSRSTLTVTDLRYDAEIPDALFQPATLPEASTSPIWTSLDAPVGPERTPR